MPPADPHHAPRFAGQTIFLTGGTGFLGGEMARTLATDEGATVRVLVRAVARAGYIQGVPGVELVSGDLSDPHPLVDAMRGCSVVLHVAAATGGDLPTQTAANVEGTRHVVQAAAQAGVKRVVHISTIAVYGYRHPGDVTEDTPPQPAHEYYGMTKAQAETIIHQEAARRGIEYAIIRPAFIYGARSGAWTGTMYDLANRPVIPFPGGGWGSSHPVHVADVVGLTLTAAHHPAAVGQVFNSAPDPAPTWRDFLNGYAALAGRQPRWINLPVWGVQPFAHAVSAFARPDGIAKIAPEVVPWLARRFSYRMDKAREQLGWRNRVSLADGIASTADWLAQRARDA